MRQRVSGILGESRWGTSGEHIRELAEGSEKIHHAQAGYRTAHEVVRDHRTNRGPAPSRGAGMTIVAISMVQCLFDMSGGSNIGEWRSRVQSSGCSPSLTVSLRYF